MTTDGTLTARRAVADLDHILVGAGKVVESLKNLYSIVLPIVDGVNADLQLLSKHETRQTKRVRIAYKNLQDAAQKLLKVVDEAERIANIGTQSKLLDNIKRILNLRSLNRRQLRRQKSSSPDQGPDSLAIFTDHLKRAITRVEQAYQEFKESIVAASKATYDASAEAKKSNLKVGQNREAMRIKGFGGTCITAAAVGGGFALLAGPLAAAAAVTTVFFAGAGVTYRLDQSYGQLQDKFKEQLSLLDKWLKCADDMEDKVDDLHRAVEGLSRAVEDLNCIEPNMIEFSFSLLQQSFLDIGQTCGAGRGARKNLISVINGVQWSKT